MSQQDETRAELRRRTWSSGLAHAGEEAHRADLRFWRASTPAERVEAAWAMAEESFQLQGNHGALPRLQRSAWGVRKR